MNYIKVRICPHVFNPIIGRTTAFFIQNMVIPPASKVLEIGTGTGAIATVAAMDSNHVIATDISPEAIACTKTTLRLNQVEERVQILRGDLFAPVQDQQFDIILFNPPYLAKLATTQIAKSWCAGENSELIHRFISEAKAHLTPKGAIQILFSSAAPLHDIIPLIKEQQYHIKVLAKGRLFGFLESLVLLRLS